MVDLNRRIRATQARQGGFSAHVLPSPVNYLGVERIIAYATSTGFQVVGSYESANIPAPVSGLICSSCGPFGEPATNNIDPGGSLYSIQLGAASPGTGEFTLEWWFRLASTLADQSVDIMTLLGDNGRSQGIITKRANPTADTIQHVINPFAVSGARRVTGANISAGPWNHMAIARSGTDHRAYFNGSLMTDVFANDGYAGTEPINLANASIFAGQGSQNKINVGQMRYIKKAIYSGSSITVPASPFI